MGVVEYMKKLVKLLNDLESIGLSEQSSILRESINSITKALDKVESNIGEEIIVKAKEKKFDEIAKLVEVPTICQEYKDYIISVFENPNVEVEKLENEEYQAEVNINEDEFDGSSVSATDGAPEVIFKVGEEIEHTELGKGVISKIDLKDGTGNQILIIQFSSGTKSIECNPENLEKYFGLVKEVDSKKKESYKKVKNFNNGFNLYTTPEYFTHRKPVMVEMFGHQYRATNWRDAAYCILNIYYKKHPKVVTKALKESGNFSLSGKDLSAPLTLSGEEKGPFFESAKSAMEMVKMLNFVGEYLTVVMKKDVCKNTLIYLKRKD